jgi:formylglycine-generating enzyme required for sulfatase activity
MGSVVCQRLRWIEPGSFWMGSPKSEPQRSGDESPQHRVVLTQGFWLADTACTQALWLAVVGGENPSHFTGDEDLPVEQVSWDEITQKFLPKLQAWLPEGVEAVLPSEAMWECACRAGTETPFSFGEQISPEQVNYNGDHPYNGGPKGEDRGKTVPVKGLPANGWGLYQMHGNVWEWCWDGQRPYSEAEAVDPEGAVGDGPRAVRGGAWCNNAWHARSAFRLQFDRADRGYDLGVRLALRFKSSQGAEP